MLLVSRGIFMAQRNSRNPTLSLYTIVWGSALWKRRGHKVPWHDPSPRVVAQAASHMIWTYVQTLEGEWWKVLLQLDKPSVIGHTSLLARMTGEPDLLLSSIGGDVGFYDLTHRKHLRHFPPLSSIIASCHLAESLAGHLATGRWETLPDFAARIHERGPPRVSKTELTGDKARDTYAHLADIKRQTELDGSGPGAPRHFGLNTTAVRLVSDMATPLPLRAYRIGRPPQSGKWWWPFGRPRSSPALALAPEDMPSGDAIEIHGGCANAAASILGAVGLGSLVPASARFELRLTLSDFEDSVLPMLVGPDAFDDNGIAIDGDLVGALDRLPKVWGDKDTLRFTDPNYWIETMPETPEAMNEVYHIALLHMI